jgi:hypothetical protein
MSASNRFCNPPSPLTVSIISVTKSLLGSFGLNSVIVPFLFSSGVGTSKVPALAVEI